MCTHWLGNVTSSIVCMMTGPKMKQKRWCWFNGPVRRRRSWLEVAPSLPASWLLLPQNYENTRAQLHPDLRYSNPHQRSCSQSSPHTHTHLYSFAPTSSPHITNGYLLALVLPLLALHRGCAFCVRWYKKETFQLHRVNICISILTDFS